VIQKWQEIVDLLCAERLSTRIAAREKADACALAATAASAGLVTGIARRLVRTRGTAYYHVPNDTVFASRLLNIFARVVKKLAPRHWSIAQIPIDMLALRPTSTNFNVDIGAL
jgi:hypothetical protein